MAQVDRQKPRYLNLTPAIAIYAAVLGTLSCFMLFISMLWIGRLTATKQIWIEHADGTSASALPADYASRSPETIKNFVRSELGGLFDWTGTIPPTNAGDLPQKDPGVPVSQSQGQKITTATWQAGFGIAETFRRTYLEAIAGKTPQSLFQDNPNNGSPQGRIVIGPNGIGEPQQIAANKWRVPVVGNLLVFQNGDNLGTVALAFNKEVFVQSVDFPVLPPKPTGLDYAIYGARKAGLEIYSMPDLNLGL